MLYLLLIILFVEQLADWYSTRTILAKGGTEQNPVMAKLFAVLGVDVTLAIKTICTLAAGYYIGEQYIYGLILLILVYVWVLYHNWQSL